MPERKCEVCERIFERPRNLSSRVFSTRRFCCLKCFGASVRKNRLCPICGNPVQCKDNKLYCSWVCAKKRPRKRGASNACWKGGRTIDPSGHVRVRMDPDHKWARGMRMQHGYVLEHRLVMAEKLGRALDNHETVHHINGNPGDNRIENLQIRTGRHGRGACFQCLDCGSKNVKSITI